MVFSFLFFTARFISSSSSTGVCVRVIVIRCRAGGGGGGSGAVVVRCVSRGLGGSHVRYATYRNQSINEMKVFLVSPFFFKGQTQTLSAARRTIDGGRAVQTRLFLRALHIQFARVSCSRAPVTVNSK